MFKVLVLGAMVVMALLVVHVPAGSTAAHDVGITCTVATTGAGTKLFGPTNASATWVRVADVVPVFSGCTAGPNSATVTCGTAVLDATSYSAGPPRVTSGTLRNISCTVTFGSPVCTTTVTGSVKGTYNNDTWVLTVLSGSTAGNQSLAASWTNNTTCNSFYSQNASDVHAGSANFGQAPASGGFPAALLYNTSLAGGGWPSVVQP